MAACKMAAWLNDEWRDGLDGNLSVDVIAAWRLELEEERVRRDVKDKGGGAAGHHVEPLDVRGDVHRDLRTQVSGFDSYHNTGRHKQKV